MGSCLAFLSAVATRTDFDHFIAVPWSRSVAVLSWSADGDFGAYVPSALIIIRMKAVGG